MTNKFQALQNLTKENETITTSELRPPSIYIEVPNIKPLIQKLNEILGLIEHTLKQLNDKQVKVQVQTPNAYKAMIRTLKEKNAEYYTFQPKTERKFKFVIKGLYPKLNIEYIKTDVQETYRRTQGKQYH